jgi:signal peptidase I
MAMRWSGTARGAAVVVLSATVVAGLRAVAFDAMTVQQLSMSPTLVPGEVVLVEKLDHSPERGELAAMYSPADGKPVIKRVVGVGGDVVAIEDGKLYVNREPVDEPYVDLDSVDGVYYGPVTVPDGMLHVLGDARAGSVDSRAFGSVAEGDVIGTVRAALWPLTGLSSDTIRVRTETPDVPALEQSNGHH